MNDYRCMTVFTMFAINIQEYIYCGLFHLHLLSIEAPNSDQANRSTSSAHIQNSELRQTTSIFKLKKLISKEFSEDFLQYYMVNRETESERFTSSVCVPFRTNQFNTPIPLKSRRNHLTKGEENVIMFKNIQHWYFKIELWKLAMHKYNFIHSKSNPLRFFVRHKTKVWFS